MGCPAGMAQPDMRGRDNGIGNNCLKLGQLTRRPMLHHLSILQIDNPR